ncbi:E3 ubiquitin ligase component cereblon isoform X2 [Rhynchophorus ferrugineus]|uniref:E3 ubiquitin ligase component cereblon isoform X2 n=1 Tax=Rhynchophorus ferrugineus TaxID=354439 RepID=UPI003FCE6E30
MAEPENQDSDQEDQDLPMEIENGHISDNSSDYTSTSDRNSPDEDLELINSITGEYDRDIPTTHGYLGKLNPLRGYTIFEDGDVLKVFAIYTNTLVFPGFTLPLVMTNNYENGIMQNFIDKNNRVFVLLCANSGYSGLYEYGITMEIFEISHHYRMLHIKARGRQRCERVPGSKIENASARIKLVTVRIIAEPPIVSPLQDSQLLALKLKRKWKIRNIGELKQCKRYRRYHAAQYVFPSWVYDMNEVSYYIDILLDALSSYEYIPKDPEKLSYWFVQNYQLSHNERLKILGLKSTLERLKLECMYLKLGRTMCCDNCNALITDPSKVFVMSKDGTQSNYVNPGGHVYETVTVLSAINFQLVGDPSRQFSWFPGYAWTIIQCIYCNKHLGWKFTSNNLSPKEFFGLAKSGFKVMSQDPPDDLSILK